MTASSAGRASFFAVILAQLPQAAAAECLGAGCYDALAWLLGGAIAISILGIIAIVLMFMRRRRAALITGCVILVAALLVLVQM